MWYSDLDSGFGDRRIFVPGEGMLSGIDAVVRIEMGRETPAPSNDGDREIRVVGTFDVVETGFRGESTLCVLRIAFSIVMGVPTGSCTCIVSPPLERFLTARGPAFISVVVAAVVWIRVETFFIF